MLFVLDRDSTMLSKAGFYILNNADKFYMPEKGRAGCDRKNNIKECPKRCEDADDKDPKLCYEKVCPPVRTCTKRGGRVLMVNKVSKSTEKRVSFHNGSVQQKDMGGRSKF